MQINRLKKHLIMTSTILWCAVTVLGWKNENYLICLILSVFIMGCYLMLGAANYGILGKKFFIYPILAWAVVWIATFISAAYFADIYNGIVPPLFLGLHPSLACIIVGFWFGGLMTILLGWRINKNEWMSSDDWDEFVRKIKELDHLEHEEVKQNGQ